MSIQISALPVKQSVVVEAPIAQAFKVFTEGFGSFKPPEHNLLGVEIAETVFEPRAGDMLNDCGQGRTAMTRMCPWQSSVAIYMPYGGKRPREYHRSAKHGIIGQSALLSFPGTLFVQPQQKPALPLFMFPQCHRMCQRQLRRAASQRHRGLASNHK
ncbi:hypothetical protein [Paracoccus methylarcula]|uniref:hypothetical protein n=1 Tax=Paracoccus methylarcula TaxID=72022 RepID=UPI001B86A58E|nr:hypothetical protein [Paracoccus methylarcula]